MKSACMLGGLRIAFLLSLIVLGGSHSAEAAIIGEDNRQELEHFSLTADERAAMYQTIGLVECRRQDTIGRGTAFVIDGGQNLLSNAHVFREGDQHCTFSRKQSKQSLLIDVDKATVGSTDMLRKGPHQDERANRTRDWIIVPLRTPTWTPTFKLGAAPQNGEELFHVGVISKGKELDKSKLVGRRCIAEERRTSAIGQDEVYGDCDGIRGDSGSPIFIRRNGVLEIVAIHSASSDAFSESIEPRSPSDREISVGLIIDGPLRELIANRFPANPSATLLRPFNDPNHRPLFVSPQPVVGKPDGYPGYTRAVPVEPTAPREELALSGLKLRGLSPDDQILYGIPDEIKGVLVASVRSRVDFVEGDVLLGETLQNLSKLKADGTRSLTVSARHIDGQVIQRTLSLD